MLPPMPALPPAMVSGPVHVNDIEMWRAEFGPRNGKPVVMVHGGLANSNYFGTVIPFLVAQGFRVIAVDSRGHGRSTRSAQRYSYELMTSDVVAMLDALHVGKADLVGWSDGAIIGIVMAIRPSGAPEPGVRVRRQHRPGGLEVRTSTSPGLFKAFEVRAGKEYRRLSPTPGQYDSFLAQISQMWATEPHIADAALEASPCRSRSPTGATTRRIKQSHSRAIAGTIPNAHLVILPGVSHFAMLQNPPLFARAVLDALTAPWDD